MQQGKVRRSSAELRELETEGLLKPHLLRNARIRERFSELRGSGYTAGTAIRAIAAEENISEKRIDAIVYGYG